MGIQAWYDVWCDHPECIDWTHGGPNRADAARSARAAGWKRTKDGWRCPAHQRPANPPSTDAGR